MDAHSSTYAEQMSAVPHIDTSSSTAATTPEGSLIFSPVTRSREDATLPVRTICCVGAGYVGGPTAAAIAYNNPQLRVTVVDTNQARIRRWNSAHPPIYEPGLGEMVRIARDGSRATGYGHVPKFNLEPNHRLPIIVSGLREVASDMDEPMCSWSCDDWSLDGGATTWIPARAPNLFFTTEVAASIAEADMVLVSVNTPTKTKGAGSGSATDMAAFEIVTQTVAKHAKEGAVIVEKSTVPVKTAQLVKDTLKHHRPAEEFEVLSNPEFLAAGTAVMDLLHADRILIGCSPSAKGHRAAASLASVYTAWIPADRIITTNVFSSELAKLVANSMLAQRISSINSIAAVCEETGADVDEVAHAIGADARIGNKFLKAGIGFGGSCFKKDVLSLVYLAESLHLPEVGAYWRGVITMNEFARDRFVDRVVRCLNNTLTGKKVVVLGYAFKKDTNDTRESPALEMVRMLAAEGPTEIAIHDPCCLVETTRSEVAAAMGSQVLKCNGGCVEVHSNPLEACRAAHALLITTDFDEYKLAREVATPGASEHKSRSREAARPEPNRAGPIDIRSLRPKAPPTQMELWALHRFLADRLETACQKPAERDPLRRFVSQPSCPENCPDCMTERQSDGCPGYGAAALAYRSKEPLDWAKIGFGMCEPKWVFDGRGVLDITAMRALGFRIESVGRQERQRFSLKHLV